MNPTYLNPRYKSSSIRTRFTYRFLRTLKQVNTRHVRARSSSTRRSLEIRNAANMCMAATVGWKRAWSRAMLSKIRRRRRRMRSVGTRYKSDPSTRRSCVVAEECNNKEDEMCSTQELREIVPGGERMDPKSLLDETAHYIKCLTTQVQVMKDILHLYSS